LTDCPTTTPSLLALEPDHDRKADHGQKNGGEERQEELTRRLKPGDHDDKAGGHDEKSGAPVRSFFLAGHWLAWRSPSRRAQAVNGEALRLPSDF
jgi:hypothetical protein